jgi:broad specificity phosphatase PhoE
MTHNEPTAGDDSVMVDVHVRMPRLWRELLRESAHVQRISSGALIRIILSGFLSQRFEDRMGGE